MGGVATGKGVEDIVRDLGRVVKDPESFRYAGSKVFSQGAVSHGGDRPHGGPARP